MIAYIGTKIGVQKDCSIYTLTLSYANHPHQSFTKSVSTNSRHRLVLTCINDVLSGMVESGIFEELVIHSGNHLIEHEYNCEYKKYGSFSNSTADIDLWETINKNCKDNDIKLVIYGREVEHYLKKICKGAV